MAPKPLDILKKGLDKFSNKVKARKEALTLRLSRKESISSADERWLDHEANTIDEERVLHELEAASDYERGLERLDVNGKAIVKKLREWAGDLKKVAGNKRKRSDHEKKIKEPRKTPNQPKAPAPPVFTKKENATLAQRIEIIDWYHKNGKNQTETAKHFDAIYPNLRIRQPLVSDWIKREAAWREKWAEADKNADRHAKRARQTEHPEVSEMMDLWVSKAMNDGILLTGEVLRQKWNTFANLVGIPEDERLKLSDGWLTRFKDRNGLKEMKRHGEAASSGAATVENERKRVQGLIEGHGYELRDIFNMDETGLFYGTQNGARQRPVRS
ncbi:hypothetical protein M413DRAFT_424966 [Hebeloma cylindrosporum]|uniref:HTH CENPB-type domain-containing protein n=1 Tax=Hebeloma cylindrosporum TaxID=76867 RepID=A0A0C3BY22_HEBCY|nr:hypothetical protein M413DRAFT_424966 [Hebeloma cylindrosporum h7]